jgi:hypothetical protein
MDLRTKNGSGQAYCRQAGEARGLLLHHNSIEDIFWMKNDKHKFLHFCTIWA